MEDKKQRKGPKRIFINDIHKYSSKYIAQVLKLRVGYEVIIFSTVQQSFLRSSYRVVTSEKAQRTRDRRQRRAPLVQLSLPLKLWEHHLIPLKKQIKGTFHSNCTV